MKSCIPPRRINSDLPRALILILLICTFSFLASFPSTIATAADKTPSPSFSCQKDNLTQVEKIICSDPELAALDQEMNKLFEAKKKSLPEKERQSFFDDQRRWLKQRDNSCNITKNVQATGQAFEEKKTCLKNLYQARIKDLKTSDSDEWRIALNELANRIQVIGKNVTTNVATGIDIGNGTVSVRYLFPQENPDIETDNGEEVIKAIKKHYILTESQIAEISKFTQYAEGVELYLQDVDQDGIKDLILRGCGGKGPFAECAYLFYHGNRNKTLTKTKGPDLNLSNDVIHFVHLNNKTYIGLEYNYLYDITKQPKTIIELFSLKNENGRKGIGKIQINYVCQIKGKLVKGDNPAFHILEEKSDAMVRYFERKEPMPLATSLMNNPAWTYDGKDAEKISKLIGKEYYTANFQKNDSRYQLLDIDNDGKKEVVCYLVYKTEHKYYNRMIMVKMGTSAPISYIDVDKHYPELSHIDVKFYDYYCCNSFSGLEKSGLKGEEGKGSEYFALSDGKENYVIKIGINQGEKYGMPVTNGYILGIYKLKAGEIKLVDAMYFDTKFTFKDVTDQQGVPYSSKNELIEDFDKAANRNPKDAEAHLYTRGITNLSLKNSNQAIKDFDKVIEINPKNAKAYYMRGEIYSYYFGQYDQAIKDFNKAIELNPNFAQAYCVRGRAYFALGNGNKQLNNHNQAIGDYNQAIKDFSRAIELNPNFGEAYHWRGLTYHLIGNEDQSKIDFDKADKLGPKSSSLGFPVVY